MLDKFFFAFYSSLMAPAGPELSLGVDWHYYPELRYYRERKRYSWLALGVVPPFEGRDLYYVRVAEVPPSILPRLSFLKTYPLTDSVLARLNLSELLISVNRVGNYRLTCCAFRPP